MCDELKSKWTRLAKRYNVEANFKTLMNQRIACDFTVPKRRVVVHDRENGFVVTCYDPQYLKLAQRLGKTIQFYDGWMWKSMNSEIFELVDEVLDEFVQNKKEFTAYEVTKEVRNRTKEEFLHGDVRKHIHRQMSITNDYENWINPTWGCIQYQPKATVVPPVNQPAVVTRLFPYKYNQNVNIVSSRGICSQPMHTGNKSAIQEFKICKRISKKRVCVPKYFIYKLGVKNGQEVGISNENGNIYLKPKVSNTGIFYTVDSKGSFKLSNRVLQELGFSEKDNIVMKLDSNKIVLDKN